jgi:hypothetical protein
VVLFFELFDLLLQVSVLPLEPFDQLSKLLFLSHCFVEFGLMGATRAGILEGGSGSRRNLRTIVDVVGGDRIMDVYDLGLGFKAP